VTAAVETGTFGVSSGEVAAIDTWVADVGHRWGASERTVFRTRLCIAELAANVLEHGVASSAEAYIAVTLIHIDDGIVVEFRDSGRPFDPTIETAAAPIAASIESASTGGRGLMLVRAYAGDIAYSHDGACNRITLKIKSS
jgi:anti-sigma regulatory factor (Ser/Thr protein kinase)